MTNGERLQFHEQLLASIERNIAALVEAQQKTDERVDTLAQAVAGLVELVGSNQNMMREVIDMVRLMADRQDYFEEWLARVAQHQEEADRRQRESDRRMDRLAETLQRFLDSQMGRDGRE